MLYITTKYCLELHKTSLKQRLVSIDTTDIDDTTDTMYTTNTTNITDTTDSQILDSAGGGDERMDEGVLLECICCYQDEKLLSRHRKMLS